MCKPIAFGVNKVDKFEFGDMYHVGVALVCDPTIRLAFVGKDPALDQYCKFIQSFDPTNIDCISAEYYQKNKQDFQHAGATADIIAKHAKNEESLQRCLEVSTRTDWDKQLCSYVSSKLNGDTATRKVLVWIRNQDYRKDRNSTVDSINQLLDVIETDLSCKTILIGNSLGEHVKRCNNFIEFYRDDDFASSNDGVHRQLRMFRLLHEKWSVMASVGLMSGGMDGPAFFAGLPTIFFCKKNDDQRMAKVCKMFEKIQIIHIPSEDEATPFKCHSDAEIHRLSTHLKAILAQQD